MKRNYTIPKLTRVKLDPEQAVLAVCSASGVGTSDGVGSAGKCQDGGCRQKSKGGHSAYSS